LYATVRQIEAAGFESAASLLGLMATALRGLH
jgi:hypothetical protein